MTLLSTAPAPLPWAGGAYSIKCHGVTLNSCDAELVQTPGCIQAHGALLVLRPSELVILQASENSADLLGIAPEQLLGQPIDVVTGEAGASQLRASMDGGATDANPLRLFTLPGRSGRSGRSGLNGCSEGPALDVSMHTLEGLALAEFEPSLPSDEAQAQHGYALVKKAVGQLRQATGLLHFFTIAVQEIRELTGLDRVMVYQFHPEGHGDVYAESGRADLAPLVNLQTGQTLLVTQCALRSASVMDTEYLQNMGVTAGLTMALRRGAASSCLRNRWPGAGCPGWKSMSRWRCAFGCR